MTHRLTDNALYFTLIEMLVTATIVLLLASLLLPAVTSARNRGKTTLCGGNLRQLGTSMLMYGMDHESYLPPYMRNSRLLHGGTNWGSYLLAYFNDVRILDCPASPDGPPDATAAGLHLQDGNYGWNYDGTQGKRGPLHLLVSSPSQCYLFFDSGDPCITVGANHWDNLLEELDLDWNSGLEGANRHEGCVDIIHVDGHARRLMLNSFLAAPCDSFAAPWFIEWRGGSLKRGHIPFPYR